MTKSRKKTMKRALSVILSLFCLFSLATQPVRADSSTIKTGWITKNGKRYFAKEDGSYYKNRVITFGSKKAYYMGADGSVQEAVALWGDHLRYFDGKGNFKKDAGWVYLNGKRYFADENGYLYRNQVISFGEKKYYYMGKDGSVQTGPAYWGGNLRFFDGKGGVSKGAGWINHNGKRYFADARGYLYHDQVITFGPKAYFMGSDGSVRETVSYWGSNLRYFDGKGGVSKSAGWIDYQKKRYFANERGNLYHDQIITFGPSKAYYMGSDGAAQDVKEAAKHSDLARAAMLDRATGGAKLTGFGGYTLNRDVERRLTNTITTMRSEGYNVGFVAMNLTTGKGLSYNPDGVFWSASTIKGPYITSMVERYPESYESKYNLIKAICTYSDNGSYAALRRAYGSTCIRNYCIATGIRPEIADSNYVYISPKELAKLWTKMYIFFEGSERGAELSGLFSTPVVSPIRNQLGAKYTTRSKAGWNDTASLSTTHDAGLVYTSNGPYVVAVMSNCPENFSYLNTLVVAIHDAAVTW